MSVFSEEKKFNYDKDYYKIMNLDMKHHDFQYQMGLNIFPSKFDPNCIGKGGFYFCKQQDIQHWLGLYNCYTIAQIRIPNTARVVDQGQKYKTDMLIICDIDVSFNADDIKNPIILQTFELCEVAVRYNPHYIGYVHDQTDYLCSLALNRDPSSMLMIRNQIRGSILYLIKHNGFLVQYFKATTRMLMYLALKCVYELLKKAFDIVKLNQQQNEKKNAKIRRNEAAKQRRDGFCCSLSKNAVPYDACWHQNRNPKFKIVKRYQNFRKPFQHNLIKK